MYFLGLDIGTTKIKCGIYNDKGDFVYYDSIDYGVKQLDRESYIDIYKIADSVVALLSKAYTKFKYDSVAISSLGESFVLLDENDKIIFLPMLYTDPRGKDEAEKYSDYASKIYEISGVCPQSMYSIYKLLWIKNNRKEIYKKAKKLLLVGEYISYILTGERHVDYSLISRTGVFDIRKKEISKELCELFGVDKNIFSPSAKTGSFIGYVKEDIIKNNKKIHVFLGGHDQVCATLGAGAYNPDICADGLGTVECLTAIFDKKNDSLTMGMQGYPNVPFGIDNLYCTYIFNYSCGSLNNWWIKNIVSNEGDSDIYSLMESDFKNKPTGLLVLPYFAGAATPYQNIDAKGAIVNLSLSDSKSKIYQAILEGLSFENKLNLDVVKKYGVIPKKIIVTGGGSNSKKWLQIKANILNKNVYPLKVKEAGICGTAMLGASALLNCPISEIIKIFVKYGDVVKPQKETVKEYLEIYKKYKKLYLTLKKFN